MPRLIDADAVIDIAMQYCPDDDGSCSKADVDIREMLDEIESLPTVDAEPVVRCKDCKWGEITDYGAGEVLECVRDRLYRINSISLEGETYFRKVEPDNYCAWGERREDETC